MTINLVPFSVPFFIPFRCIDAALKVAYFTYTTDHPLSISSLTLVLKSVSFLLLFLIIVILKASPFTVLISLPFTHNYGTRSLSLDLGLRHGFRWIFLIADVKTPIIGSDFLSHHGLIVDVNKKQLLDNTTNLQVNVLFSREAKLSLTPLPHSSNPFTSIVSQYPTILQPTNYHQSIKHSVTHH